MQSVYTVGQINSYIKNMFEQDYLLKQICVKGEVSNCKYHSSGHIYFTLKDESAAIACVLFAGNRNGLDFHMADGNQVQVEGSVEVYTRDGKYQIYAKKIIQSGIGNLYERFEALKRKLSEEGLFDAEYKRRIPKYVKTLGVVTAPTGAAVRDIITVSKRRNPSIQIILYPAIVQGDVASTSIIKGISALEAYGVDVIIVGRGGGSIEDLWAFNEEAVAQAVFQCNVPVISAVGHETDFTITDFVADLRAATPSAAAELAICKISDLTDKIGFYRECLRRTMNTCIEDKRRNLFNYQLRLKAVKPMNRLKEQRMYLMSMENRLQSRMNDIIKEKRTHFLILQEQMKRVSVQEKLENGYCLITDEESHLIRDIQQVSEENRLNIRLVNGTIAAKVISTAKI